MLRISFDGRDYELSLIDGGLIGSFSVDEDWRTLDYKGGGSALSLTAATNYLVSADIAIEFSERGLVDFALELEDAPAAGQELPILTLNLQLAHTTYDIDQMRCIPLGDLGLFPRLGDLAGRALSQEMVDNTHLSFPGFAQHPTLYCIEFGACSSDRIQLQYAGACRDIFGTLSFEIEEDLPFRILSRIEGYANEFRGRSIEERIGEIKACFQQLYGDDGYEAAERIICRREGAVEVAFRTTAVGDDEGTPT